MIEPKHPQLPIVRQCELLGLARASYYHQPEPESDENLRLMRVIDETYLAHPEFGSQAARGGQAASRQFASAMPGSGPRGSERPEGVRPQIVRK